MNTASVIPLRRSSFSAGFTATELVVVVAVIGIIMAVALPAFFGFFRTAALRAGAEEMASALNRARQMAIRDNTNVCVTDAGGRLRFRFATCAGTVWTGPGTDAAGFIQLSNNVTVENGGTVTFSYIGTATPAIVYTVRNPQDGRTMSVNVAASGRVSIGP